jgi:hypothetical protein
MLSITVEDAERPALWWSDQTVQTTPSLLRSRRHHRGSWVVKKEEVNGQPASRARWRCGWKAEAQGTEQGGKSARRTARILPRPLPA